MKNQNTNRKSKTRIWDYQFGYNLQLAFYLAAQEKKSSDIIGTIRKINWILSTTEISAAHKAQLKDVEHEQPISF